MGIWMFPKIVVPQNGWFIRQNPIKMDDLGVPLFSETPIYMIGSRRRPEGRTPTEHLGICERLCRWRKRTRTSMHPLSSTGYLLW